MEEFYICPYCNNKIIGNKKVFANHIRWCKSNPKYNEIYNSFKNKLADKKEEKKEFLCKCCICNSTYIIKTTESKYNKGNYKKTCSKHCAVVLSAKNTNKNYKNEKIKKSLLLKKGEKDYNYEYNILKFDSQNNEYIKICEHCNQQFRTLNKYKKYCSDKCKKFSRLSKIDINEKQKYLIYKKYCSFNFSLRNFPKEFDFDIINKYGWYSASNRGNNLTGISRDHMYSCKNGYINCVDPYIISHPANCKLLIHSENISKNYKCSIELEELKNRIKEWNKKYGEFPNNIDYEYLEFLEIKIIKF